MEDKRLFKVEEDLWWGYLCPAMANIGPLKEAQTELIEQGCDWAEAGRIISKVHKYYVNVAHETAQRYVAERVEKTVEPPSYD